MNKIYFYYNSISKQLYKCKESKSKVNSYTHKDLGSGVNFIANPKFLFETELQGMKFMIKKEIKDSEIPEGISVEELKQLFPEFFI